MESTGSLSTAKCSRSHLPAAAFSGVPAVCAGVLATIALACGAFAAEFQAHIVDRQPGKVVYAVTLADIDGDVRNDIVAVTENRVLWYQAPKWNAHVLLDGVTKTDNVCIAPMDIDRDGQIDLALGAGWPQNGGTIQWLSRGQIVDDPWQLHPISSEPWTHRMRWADVLGKGEPQLVVAPLNATNNRLGVRLLAFEIPADPRKDRWRATVMNGQLNRLHNICCVAPDATGMKPLAGDDRPVTLTASQEGISAIALDADKPNQFRRIDLLPDEESNEPGQRGAGEIRSGRLADGTRLLATIEPMHGTDAVVYQVHGEDSDQAPERTVLTDELRGGHAICCADVDCDGSDEIIVGYREPNPSVGILLFDHQTDGTWSEQRIGSEVACEDLLVEDLNGDGWLDIVAGGRATHNVVLYLNSGVSGEDVPTR